MKKVYKCESCPTTVTIESEIHDLGDEITCVCDSLMNWIDKE